MKILAGVICRNFYGQILVANRNVPGKPYYEYLSVPWGRGEEGEDPYQTAEREWYEEMREQTVAIHANSACAATGDGYRLYLFDGYAERLDMSRHSDEITHPRWEYLDCVLEGLRGPVVPAFATILRALYRQ